MDVQIFLFQAGPSNDPELPLAYSTGCWSYVNMKKKFVLFKKKKKAK